MNRLMNFQQQQRQMRASQSGVNLRAFPVGGEQSAEEQLSGGISITAALSDFSLYVFHPFGTTGIAQGVSKAADRRDSLSLQISSVVVNIARSRNLLSLMKTGTGSNQEPAEQKFKNSVRFSLLFDISTAIFKYDMRRLNEILSFPKAWYRRAIVRRVFLGDESNSSQKFNGPSSSNSMGSGIDAGIGIGTGTGATPAKKYSQQPNKYKLSTANAPGATAAAPGATAVVPGASDDEMKLKPGLSPWAKSGSSSSAEIQREEAEAKQTRDWEAIVLFAVNFSELKVQTNIGEFLRSF